MRRGRSVRLILDLYAGPGGWDEGLRRLGITDVLGLEWDKDACATAEKAGHARRLCDVSKINPLEYQGIDGLIASPPCQGFSAAGLKKGQGDSPLIMSMMKNYIWHSNKLRDPRSALVLEPLRYALYLHPKWLAFEQVVAVEPLWRGMAEILDSLGYHTWVGTLHAEEYGVPQTRKRAFLLASKDKEVARPTPTHSKYNAWHPEKMTHPNKWVSMADALGWDQNDLIGFPRKNDLKTGGEYRERDLRPATQPSFTITSKARSWERFVDPENAGDLDWPFKRPSPTIVGSFAPHIVAAPGWRKAGDNQPGSIKITQQEAAVLQSFPKDYPWQGSRTAQFRQIGDACPPLLSQRIIEMLI